MLKTFKQGRNLEYQERQFNMALATLMRMDTLLQRLSVFSMLRQPVATQRCLLELHKEVYPFLNAADRAIAAQYWDKLKIHSAENYLEYKEGRFSILNDFDFWIRDKMLEYGLLMNRKEEGSLALYND